METQLQVWMPAVLTLFGTLIVVVLTAWLNTRALSSQIESLRSELHAELKALEERIGKQLAELEPRLTKQIMELTQRIEKLEETRGLANRGS
jgi:predicted Holliday junction resolvase-like endonuclease